MKSISASIVVLAGMFGVIASAPLASNAHPSLAMIAVAAGMITLSLGLIGWWASLKYDR